ncbi:MAG: GntR family transcriptional regulator [Kiritimatiellae bacterium]|nr:GntR family transcriptional regulator [Kiritimatiellia bacterium]MBQ6914338.1 GntR family transcriptional regulator [Kiritimatiellia bacterium]
MKTDNYKLPFGINRDARRTLVDQIVDGIRDAIRTGYYRPGDRLPPMRVFEEAFGVSRIVTNAVMARLATEGLVHPRRGAGAEVLGSDERVWRGRVLEVFRDESGVFYMNVMGARIRDRLVQAGYLVSQVTVPKGPRGCDFSLMDANLRGHVDLAILVFDDAAIESRLSSSGVPYIVVGDGGGNAATCVGTIRYRRDAASSAIARQCAASGVGSVLQVTVAEFPHDDLGAAFAGTGIKVKTWKIRRYADTGHPLDFLKGAADAFERRIAKGRDWLPDLLYFADDHLATGAFAVLPSHGVRIPEDVKVVSWANAGYGPVFRTSVARVEMDPVADGDVVAAHAIAYLESRQRVEGVFLEPTYVEGATLPS